MKTVLLFALCILSSGAAGNLFKQLSVETRNRGDSAALPFFWYLPLFLVFLIPAVRLGEVPVVPAAMAGGMFLFLAAFLLLESMKSTSLAAAVIIVNLNFLIPVILSVTVLKESAAPLQLAGMLISAAVVVLLNRNSGSDGKKGGIRSLLLPIAACLSNGLLNFFIKLNETACGGRNAFFAVLYGTAALCSVLAAVVFRLAKRSERGVEVFPAADPGGSFAQLLNRRTIPSAAGIAACNGLCFWTEGVLAGIMNAAAQFTIVTAASIAFSLAVGALFQHEPIRFRTVASFLACFCAILCQAVSL
jgi:drug/metabolite transporter (DMT)-like permease